MTAQSDILDKLAKLLALANDNANEHEAAAAMAAASRLMEQHKIDRAEIDAYANETEPIDTEVDTNILDDTLKQNASWKYSLAEGIANAHACRVFIARFAPQTYPRRPGQARRRARAPAPRFEIVGTSLDVATTRYLYVYACKQIDCFAQEALRVAGHPGKTWANSFRRACAGRVAERYMESSTRNREEVRAAASGAALARLASAEDEILNNLEALMARLGLRTVKSKSRVDAEARAAGRAAGNMVDLGTGRTKMALGAGSAGAFEDDV